ncbi:MAG TPA: hypothetical protein VFA26_12635, partial [Gemmataceae bacterium]|nr:hypothetical protein [Gemmataceae bacterium]
MATPVTHPARRALALCLFGAAAGLALADAPRPLTPEAVREEQSKFRQERAAADKDGLPKKFSPEWFDRADAFAKRGAAALQAGRLLEAREDFRKARWQLPALPPNFPAHVARIFG